MNLDNEGKMLFRKRVNTLVPRQIDRENFNFLLDQLDERDLKIEELIKLCHELLGKNVVDDEVKERIEKLKIVNYQD